MITEARAAAFEAEWERIARAKRVFDPKRYGLSDHSNSSGSACLSPHDYEVAIRKQIVRNREDAESLKRWGLYRNSILNMAEVDDVAGNCEAALRGYLLVCWWDFHDPTWPFIDTNGGSAQSPEQQPDRSLASGVIKLIVSAALANAYDIGKIKQVFMEEVISAKAGFPEILDQEPDLAWKKIGRALKKATKA